MAMTSVWEKALKPEKPSLFERVIVWMIIAGIALLMGCLIFILVRGYIRFAPDPRFYVVGSYDYMPNTRSTERLTYQFSSLAPKVVFDPTYQEVQDSLNEALNAQPEMDFSREKKLEGLEVRRDSWDVKYRITLVTLMGAPDNAFAGGVTLVKQPGEAVDWARYDRVARTVLCSLDPLGGQGNWPAIQREARAFFDGCSGKTQGKRVTVDKVNVFLLYRNEGHRQLLNICFSPEQFYEAHRPPQSVLTKPTFDTTL